MPGRVIVSVLEAENLPSSITEGALVSIKVSVGKREFQTPTNNAVNGRTSPWNFEFSYPVSNLQDNLVISILGNAEETITKSEIRTASIIERGYWDGFFNFKEAGRIHLKLRFVLTDEERRKIELMRAAKMKRKKQDLAARTSDHMVRPAAKRGTGPTVSGVTITEISSESAELENGNGYRGDQPVALSSARISEDLLKDPNQRNVRNAEELSPPTSGLIEPKIFERELSKQVNCQETVETSSTAALLPSCSTKSNNGRRADYSSMISAKVRDVIGEECAPPQSSSGCGGALFSLPDKNLPVTSQQGTQISSTSILGTLVAVPSSSHSSADMDIESSLLLPEVSALMADLASSSPPLKGTAESKERNHIIRQCNSLGDRSSVQLSPDHAVLSCFTCAENKPQGKYCAQVSEGSCSGVDGMEVASGTVPSADLPLIILQSRADTANQDSCGLSSTRDGACLPPSDRILAPPSPKTLSSSSMQLDHSSSIESIHTLSTEDMNVCQRTSAAGVAKKNHAVMGGTLNSLADESLSPGGSCTLKIQGTEQIRSGSVKARILAFEAGMPQVLPDEQIQESASSEAVWQKKIAEGSLQEVVRDSNHNVAEINASAEASAMSSAEEKSRMTEKRSQWRYLEVQSQNHLLVEEVPPHRMHVRERIIPENQSGVENHQMAVWNSRMSDDLRLLSRKAEDGTEIIEAPDSSLFKKNVTDFPSPQAEDMAFFSRENDSSQTNSPSETEERSMMVWNSADDVPIKVSQLKLIFENAESSKVKFHSSWRASVGNAKQSALKSVDFGKDQQIKANMEPQQLTPQKSFQQAEVLIRTGADSRGVHAWASSRPETLSGFRLFDSPKDHKSSEGITFRMKQVISGVVLLAGVVVLGTDAIQRDLASEKERYYVVKEGDTLCRIIPGQWNNPDSSFYKLNPQGAHKVVGVCDGRSLTETLSILGNASSSIKTTFKPAGLVVAAASHAYDNTNFQEFSTASGEKFI